MLSKFDRILAAALVVAIGSAAAIAQNYESGSVSLPSPTGAEGIAVRGIGPQFERVTIAQVRDASGYCPPTNPASGSTVQFPNNASACSIVPTATLAALTVALPTTPFDGQRAQFFTPQAITAFTLTSSSPQTINAATLAPASLSANGSVEYQYSAATQTWTRIQ